MKEEIETSDWNMGVNFYQRLAELKSQHIESFSLGFYKESLLFIMSELDWVSTDIGEEELTKLRSQCDNVFYILNKKNSDGMLLARKIIDIRRKLWDLEMKNNITRPKNQDNMSNVPMAFINRR